MVVLSFSCSQDPPMHVPLTLSIITQEGIPLIFLAAQATDQNGGWDFLPI